MEETIRETIESIKHRVPAFNALSEEDVKQGIILPLLGSAGWDRDNTQEVIPAPTSYDDVDYRLRLDSFDLVFVEAKAGGENLDDHEPQLMRYCSGPQGKDVKLGVLTNGQEWRLYLPEKKGRNESWEGKGRFCTFDIESDKIREVIKLFSRFLYRDRVKSGKAVTSAKDYRGRQQSDDIRRQAIVASWNRIVTTHNETLIELIGNVYSDILKSAPDSKRRKVGQSKPKSKLVRDFLNENESRLVMLSTSTSEQSYDAASIDVTGKKPQSFRFGDAKGEAVGWPKLLDALCMSICAEYPEEFFDKMLAIKGSRYFSKNKTDLEKARPIGSTGLYRSRQVPEIHKKILEILHVFEYPEESLEIEVKDKQRQGRSTLRWP